VLVALHVTAAGGAFVLMARRLEPAAALVATLPLLLIGSGWENLLWAFQIGFVGSVAAGTWALVAIDGDRRAGGPLAALLLVLALACSTMGLFFVAAAAVRATLDERRRLQAVWLGLPVVAFGGWYVLFGRGPIGGELASPLAAMAFAGRGLAFAVGSFLGFDLGGRAPVVGLVAGASLVVAGLVGLIAQVRQGRMPKLAIAAVAAAVAMYLVIGLARADLVGTEFWNRSRYVYVAAFLLVPGAADAARLVVRRPPPSGRLLLAGGLIGALILGANLLDLRAGRARLNTVAEVTRATFEIVDANRGAPWLDWRGLPYGWTDFETITWIIDRYGSPVHDVLVSSNAPPPGAAARDQAIIGLSISSFRVDPAAQPSAGRAVEPATTAAHAVDVVRERGCLVAATATGGSVTVAVPPGGWLELAPGSVPGLAVALGRELPPSGRFVVAIPPDSRVLRVSTPDVGPGPAWQIRVDLPRVDGLRLCVRQPER
jgi:hypothetical protein